MSNETLISSIQFVKANHEHQEIIFQWLSEPHMQEFWDNSQEHKDDIINFINDRPTPSQYFNGIFTYWIGTINNEPFCFILTADVDKNDEHPQIWLDHISTTGNTINIDFGIGNTKYLGKKLASPTLELFVKFYQEKIDPTADTFFIDPADQNPRAKHVYETAGFEMVGNFEMDIGIFKGEQIYLMVKKLYP